MGWVFLVLILLMVLIVGMAWRWHSQAMQQVDMTAYMEPNQASAIVIKKLGWTWELVDGPGTFNLVLKMIDGAPVLSVGIRPVGLGVCQVSMWVSSYKGYFFGLMRAGKNVHKKKLALARAFGELRPSSQPAPRDYRHYA